MNWNESKKISEQVEKLVQAKIFSDSIANHLRG